MLWREELPKELPNRYGTALILYLHFQRPKSLSWDFTSPPPGISREIGATTPPRHGMSIRPNPENLPFTDSGIMLQNS